MTSRIQGHRLGRICGLLAIAPLLLWFCPGPVKPDSIPIPLHAHTAGQSKALESFQHAALPFEANLGQTDPAAKFIARGMRYTVFFTANSVLLRLADPQVKGRDNVLEMKLLGARAADIRGLDSLPSRSHYYHGNSPAAWQADVPHYGKVSYQGVYPDTDFVFYGRQGELEYDVVLGSSADPRGVVLQFSGTNYLRVNKEGDLVLALRDGREILQRRPRIYQQILGRKTEVPGGYRIVSANRVRFEVGKYIHGTPLVIDPVLSYASYLGGSSGSNEQGTGIAIDASGNTYIAGYTTSAGFPTGQNPPLQSTRGGGNDAFVAELSADGQSLIYSTYLGGSSDDYAYGIAVDSAGAAYIVGTTYSGDFPATPGAYVQHNTAAFSVFVAKLGPRGSSLAYATYIGAGSGAGIAVDGSGFAYITGSTSGVFGFPTTAGAFQQASPGSNDAFIAKLNQTGSALVWSTLLGGSSYDSGTAIALDSSQSVYITGYTSSTSFPITAGAYQTALSGSGDAFVAEINSTGSALNYSTLLGGSSYEQAGAIAVDSLGFAYVTGYTDSSNFPTTGGVFQPTLNGFQDAFVVKVNQTGTGLVYATHLGSSTNGTAIAVDASGNAYIATSGGTIPVTSGAYTAGCCDGPSITKLNASGTGLIYSSQITSASAFSGIATDSTGNVYVTGYSGLFGYPTTAGAIQPSLAGGNDAIVTKLNPSGSALVYSTYLGANGGDQGFGVALDSSGNAYITGAAGSLDFPVTTEAAKSAGPYTQAFVTKFNSAGTALLYSTFVSGSGNDTGRAIAVDAAGAVYVAGQTNSPDFPVSINAPQKTVGGGYDAFLFKLSTAGQLVYSTFLGGPATEDGRGVAVDSSGNAYIAGTTFGTSLPSPVTTIGLPLSTNAFVAKLNTTGSAFLYSTVLANGQSAGGVAVDSSGSAYLTGTTSSGFPVTAGAYQTAYPGAQSGYIAKLNPDGTALVYGTYLGASSNSSYANGIAVDGAGSAYITGYTYASNFPVTAGAYQTALAGSYNAFVTKLNPTGSGLSYSTYLGGSGYDSGNAIAIDAAGNAYVAGSTQSANFPTTPGAVMEVAAPPYVSFCCSSGTAFATSLNASGTALQYSTYLGTNNTSYGITTANAVAAQSGSAIVAGTTSSPDLIGAALGFQKTLPSGAQNAFVTKISNPPAGCAYTLNQATFNFGSSGGSGIITVTTGTGCPWIAVAPSGSIVQLNSPTGAGLTGNGNGSVGFTVTPDTDPNDSGTVALFTVAGQLVTVVRTAPCSITVTPSSATWPSTLSSASVTVNAGSCNWNAFTTTPWITNVSTAPESVSYRLLPNPQSSVRTGYIYIGPQVVTITQQGTGATQATMLSPTAGTVLPWPTATFSWRPISGADQYWLDVGTTQGQGNLCAGATTNLSNTCSNVPVTGAPIYVQLYTHFSASGWQPPLQYTYTAPTQTLASLLNPSPVIGYPGIPTTVLPGTQAVFSWSTGIGADQYWLDVGTAFQQGNICGGATTTTFSTCSNLPCNGSEIFIQLWTHYPAAGWQTPREYVYQACAISLAAISSPTAGTTLAGPTVTFKWASIAGASQYWLDVGTSLGQGNICAGATTNTQSTCSTIPTKGNTVYVQLWTSANGTWYGPNRYTYTAALLNQRAQLTGLTNGGSLPGPSTTFTWNSIAGADQYWLDVGTSIGQGDLCAGATTNTQSTCNKIPITSFLSSPSPGSQIAASTTFCWTRPSIYVQLWTHFPATGWQTPVQYSFSQPAADYWLDVGTVSGQGNISAGVVTGTCQTVSNIPTGHGTIYVQVWTRFPAGTGTWYGPNPTSYTGP